jgi:hypothetical protein
MTKGKFMRKLLYVIMAMTIAAHASSQVVVALQLPSLGLKVKSQLWSASLINSGIDEPDVKLEVLFTDVSNNQPVLSGVSRVFQLKKGVTQVTASFAEPIIYNILASGYGIDANPNGFLPVGVFNICYRVIKVNTDLEERLAEECETVEIEPVSPPLLMVPYDEEKIEVTRPVFVWLPPAPQNLFSNIFYDLKVVEVNTGQSLADAVAGNLPLYFQANIPLTSQPYPPSYPELDTAKTYAWQVTAKNNSSTIAQSEIWSFRVKQYFLYTDSAAFSEYYSKLRWENDASYIICSGILRFELTNELNVESINIRIIDLSSPSRNVVQLESSSMPVKFGQNFLKLDLRNAWLTDRHIYQLEVSDLNKKKWYLKFEYRQN